MLSTNYSVESSSGVELFLKGQKMEITPMWKKAGHRIAKINRLKNRKLLQNIVSVVNFTVTGNVKGDHTCISLMFMCQEMTIRNVFKILL